MRKSVRSTLAPGPGTYHHQARSSQPTYSIGKEQRTSGGPVKATYVPGPGAYTPADDKTSNAKSISTKLKGLLDRLDSRVPGPGAYNPTSVTKKVSGGKLGAKSSMSVKELNNLGPGAYNLRGDFTSGKSDTKKKGTFGTARRSSLGAGSTAPGPGMYESGGKSVRPRSGFSFGSS